MFYSTKQTSNPLWNQPYQHLVLLPTYPELHTRNFSLSFPAFTCVALFAHVKVTVLRYVMRFTRKGSPTRASQWSYIRGGENTGGKDQLPRQYYLKSYKRKQAGSVTPQQEDFLWILQGMKARTGMLNFFHTRESSNNNFLLGFSCLHKKFFYFFSSHFPFIKVENRAFYSSQLS